MFTGFRRRSRLAVLLMCALVGSLLSVGAAPVGAESGVADDTALYSACVGPAAESQEFTDMVGSFAEEAADCLAHYGITQGTTATTFGPAADTKRIHMVRFLSRAAGPAGILLPVARDQGFTDIDGLSDQDRALVNQMAHAEIMEGRTRTEFEPNAPVTRADMAMHLAAFLEQAEVGPGGFDIDDVNPDDDDVFDDIDDLSVRFYTPILKLFEMGITQGKTATRFAPGDTVTRAQMAAFIARTLNHTNARPAGITIQVVDPRSTIFEGDEVEFIASYRDRNHQPIPNQPIDFFWGESADKALSSNGTCVSSAVEALVNSGDECEIDGSDPETDELGNLTDEEALPSVVAESDLVVFGWTGDNGDDFDDDTVEYDLVSLAVADAADKTRVTHDAGITKTVRFGEEVTVTFQLIDDDGRRIRQEGANITLRITEAECEGRADCVKNTDDRLGFSDRTQTYKTDALGRVEFDFQKSDPERGSNNDNIAMVTLGVDDPTQYPVVDEEDRDLSVLTITWSDADAGANQILIEDGTPYTDIGSGSVRRSNSIRVRVTDQYGSRSSGARVHIESTLAADIANQRPDDCTETDGCSVGSTGRDFSYSYGGAHAAETITVTIVDSNPVIDKEVVHYWGAEPGDGDISGTVVYVDTARDVMIVDDDGSDELHIVEYRTKSGESDQFSVGNTAKSAVDFEKALSEGDTVDVTYSRDSISIIAITADTTPA